MAKSRVEKNKMLYDALDDEMKNNKGNSYEKKLKSIDPNLDNGEDVVEVVNDVNERKTETKSESVLNAIAKEVNGNKTKKGEVVVVKKESKKKIKDEIDEKIFEDPISFTDKLSVEEILRAKIEQQQKIKNDKKNIKKSPNDVTYTPEMMQERINQHEGVDVRKEVRIRVKSRKWTVLPILIIALIGVIIIGSLLIFKVIKL